MANKEQLAILKQGVAAWNKWREEHPDEKIDLRGAQLDGLDLSGANFQKADIRRANFQKAILQKAIFQDSNSSNYIYILIIQNIFYAILLLAFVLLLAILIKSSITLIPSLRAIATAITIYLIALLALIPSLYMTYLSFVINNKYFDIFVVFISMFIILRGIFDPEFISFFIVFVFFYYILARSVRNESNIFYIRKLFILISTEFSTDFHKANLTGASFDNAILKHASFGMAIMTDTSFIGAQELHLARCNGTILEDRDVRELLVRGNGHGLSLKGKNLQGAHLVNANLRDLDLRETDLMQANLSGADITGAKLYGSARENWIIDDIRCEYVYWDEAGEQRTPPDRDFRPGEFEELYKQLPTFEYIFEQGFTPLDPLIMNRVVQAVNERHKEFSLELVNFDKRGQPHATFTVCRVDYVEKAREQITAGYEANRIAPEKQEQLLSDFAKMLQTSLENQSKSLDIIKQLGGSAMGDTTYNISVSGGQIAAVGTNASASGNTFQQITADLSRLGSG